MGYETHTVKQGDCISSIAFAHGFFPDTIWNDPENARLKEERKDPNVLKPGDVVRVRDKEPRTESCASENRHRFRRKGVPEKLVIHFSVVDEPRANEAYVLEIDGRRVGDGGSKTDGDGKVEAWIPPDAEKGKITFPATGDEYELRLGHLDPITEVSGVQGRLKDLGFYDGPLDGQASPALRAAVGAFQRSAQLVETGELDEETREKVRTAFGG